MNVLKRTRERLAEWLEEGRCRRLGERQAIAGGWRRVYLYHVRKTGGTSLIHSFLALSGMDSHEAYLLLQASPRLRLIAGGKVFTGWDRTRIEQGRYFFAFSHEPAHRLRLPGATFTLTCLRDPARRVLSHYKMLLHYQNQRIPHPCMAAEGPWLGGSLDDFLDRIPREHLLNQLAMFSASLDAKEAAERICGLNAVLSTELLAEGLANLSGRLGYPLKPVHVRKAEIDVDVPARTAARLREMLEPEYRLMDLLRQHDCRSLHP